MISRFRTFEREAVTDGAASGAAVVVESVADIVNATWPGGETLVPGDKATAPTTEGAAPATAQAPKEAAAKPETVEAKPATPATPAAPAPYTAEELEAFDGNYDRRDFDWTRLRPEDAKYLRKLTSGTGKYRDRLRVEHEAEMQRLRAEQAAPKPAAAPALSEDDTRQAVEELLDPATAASGLAKLLKHPAALAAIQAAAGGGDATERKIIEDLTQERLYATAIARVATIHPQYTSDELFTKDTNQTIAEDATLLAMAKSRDQERVNLAFEIAAGRVRAERATSEVTRVTEREKALTAKEADLATREAALKELTEARNREEPQSLAATSGRRGAQPQGDGTVADIVNENWPSQGLTV